MTRSFSFRTAGLLLLPRQQAMVLALLCTTIDLLAALNDKAGLADHVPGHWLPTRAVPFIPPPGY